VASGRVLQTEKLNFFLIFFENKTTIPPSWKTFKVEENDSYSVNIRYKSEQPSSENGKYHAELNWAFCNPRRDCYNGKVHFTDRDVYYNIRIIRICINHHWNETNRAFFADVLSTLGDLNVGMETTTIFVCIKIRSASLQWNRNFINTFNQIIYHPCNWQIVTFYFNNNSFIYLIIYDYKKYTSLQNLFMPYLSIEEENKENKFENYNFCVLLFLHSLTKTNKLKISCSCKDQEHVYVQFSLCPFNFEQATRIYKNKEKDEGLRYFRQVNQCILFSPKRSKSLKYFKMLRRYLKLIRDSSLQINNLKIDLFLILFHKTSIDGQILLSDMRRCEWRQCERRDRPGRRERRELRDRCG
jgi:hypothetical protein